MTKHEPNLTADPAADSDLERRIEAAILEHMAQHDGAMPTIGQNAADGGSDQTGVDAGYP
jgi:hypothetical protein